MHWCPCPDSNHLESTNLETGLRLEGRKPSNSSANSRVFIWDCNFLQTDTSAKRVTILVKKPNNNSGAALFQEPLSYGVKSSAHRCTGIRKRIPTAMRPLSCPSLLLMTLNYYKVLIYSILHSSIRQIKHLVPLQCSSFISARSNRIHLNSTGSASSNLTSSWRSSSISSTAWSNWAQLQLLYQLWWPCLADVLGPLPGCQGGKWTMLSTETTCVCYEPSSFKNRGGKVMHIIYIHMTCIKPQLQPTSSSIFWVVRSTPFTSVHLEAPLSRGKALVVDFFLTKFLQPNQPSHDLLVLVIILGSQPPQLTR